jgi:hypothetical protein
MLHHIVYKHLEHGVYSGKEGVQPTATSFEDEARLGPWNKIIGPRIFSEGHINSSLCYLRRSTSPEAVLIRREPYMAEGGRKTSFAHALIGPKDLLTPERALGAWRWKWEGAIIPQQKILPGARLPQIAPDDFEAGADAGWAELRDAAKNEIADPWQGPSVKRKMFVIFTNDSHDLAIRLLTRLILSFGSSEFIEDGFSTFETKYIGADGLPQFVFAAQPTSSGRSNDRIVIDLRRGKIPRGDTIKDQLEAAVGWLTTDTEQQTKAPKKVWFEPAPNRRQAQLPAAGQAAGSPRDAGPGKQDGSKWFQRSQVPDPNSGEADPELAGPDEVPARLGLVPLTGEADALQATVNPTGHAPTKAHDGHDTSTIDDSIIAGNAATRPGAPEVDHDPARPNDDLLRRSAAPQNPNPESRGGQDNDRPAGVVTAGPQFPSGPSTPASHAHPGGEAPAGNTAGAPPPGVPPVASPLAAALDALNPGKIAAEFRAKLGLMLLQARDDERGPVRKQLFSQEFHEQMRLLEELERRSHGDAGVAELIATIDSLCAFAFAEFHSDDPGQQERGRITRGRYFMLLMGMHASGRAWPPLLNSIGAQINPIPREWEPGLGELAITRIIKVNGFNWEREPESAEPEAAPQPQPAPAGRPDFHVAMFYAAIAAALVAVLAIISYLSGGGL